MRFELKEEPWRNMNKNSLVCHKPDTIVSVIAGDIMTSKSGEYIIKELQGNYLLIDKVGGSYETKN